MFERFAETARQAVIDARQEAAWAGQDKVGSEHILLAVLREPGPAAEALTAAGVDAESLRAWLPRGDHEATAGLDADALSTLGIDLDAVRRAADGAFGPGALDRARVPGRNRMPFAPDAKHTLAGAARQAVHRNQRWITTGHLLFGILDQTNNVALTVLTGAGTDIAALRADVERRLAEPSAS
jgi:ATP-dependent Clp protease ATP-binding subunit ClpA